MRLNLHPKLLLFFLCANKILAGQIDIAGPAGSEAFGTMVVRLANGNFVVTDPRYDAPGPVVDVGAVYLYNGTTRKLISRLTGSKAGDKVGSTVHALKSGDYVVCSPSWANGTADSAGAVTWCSGSAGIDGVVSVANSLVGTQSGDMVGTMVFISTSSNDYAVTSIFWANGNQKRAGSVTWASGPLKGAVSPQNSLVGNSEGDMVGTAVHQLKGGQVLVTSMGWAGGKGAVTWCPRFGGVTGVVSSANSLVGSQSGWGFAGGLAAYPLRNGHYVVANPNWSNGSISAAGAVVWCNGTTGRKGVFSGDIGLKGDRLGGNVGAMVTPLENGNYVVSSGMWQSMSDGLFGAVTFCLGDRLTTATVSESNSLVGLGPMPSFTRPTALTNGHYVVASPNWGDESVLNRGAVTWCNGTTGRTGKVGVANSLVGASAEDRVGSGGITALKSGHYAVSSPEWNNGPEDDVGAVNWCVGTRSTSAVVSAANSLIGNTSGDRIGDQVQALDNGHYVVGSPDWDRGTIVDAGAVTWCDGTRGLIGSVGIGNSLVGKAPGDAVGENVVGITAASNYVVCSPDWDHGSVVDAGAVTWSSGAKGITGEISSANSMVGTNAGDAVGSVCFPLWASDMKDYLVWSTDFRPGNLSGAGAVSWCDGVRGTVGQVKADFSVMGRVAQKGDSLVVPFFGWLRDLLIVGQPSANLVSILDRGMIGEPEIVVRQPVSNNLVDNKSSRGFGRSRVGNATAARVFTIRNTGTAPLTGLALRKSGAHTADFQAGSLGAKSLAPGASTTFRVVFKPRAAGERRAVIRLSSNDGDENPFDIPVKGTGVK